MVILLDEEKYNVLLAILITNRWVVDIDRGTVWGVKDNKYLGCDNGNGYLRLGTTYQGTFYRFGIHQIILVADGVNLVGLTVNHINQNTHDNRKCNLEAVTQSENSRKQMPNIKKANCKLTPKQREEIVKLLSKGVSGAEIGRMFGIARQSVYRYKKYLEV